MYFNQNRTSNKTIYTVLISLLLGHLLFCRVTYPFLPAFIPVNFNADNTIDMAQKSLSSWFSLFFVNLFLSLSLTVIAKSIFKIPLKYINLPNKKDFLKLPKQSKSKVLNTVFFHTMVITLTGVSILFILQITLFLLSTGQLELFPNLILAFFTAVIFIEIFLMIIKTKRIVDDEIHKHNNSRL